MRFLHTQGIIVIFILCFLTCYFVVDRLIKKFRKDQNSNCFDLSEEENINNMF